MKCPACQTENEPGVDACFTCGRSFGTLTRGSVVASRYAIVRLLGKGGMGTVYEAHDQMLDEAVAIKVLRPDFGSGEEMAQRFRSEIKLARKVSHPNVCRIHDYGETGEVSYISMALLEGTDLGQVLREHAHGLPPEEAFDVAVQTAEGLAAIHAAGIIHRDLKTANIMRDSHGMVRVMDFGIATDFRHGKRRGLTATGEVLGTVEYISPEQCQGLDFDFRSDVYALGVMIFEIFTGDVPFRGNTQVATLFKHIQEPPPLDGPQGSRLPEGLVPVLRRALAKTPDERYPTAAELAQALREARGRFVADSKRGLPVAAPPPIAEPPRPAPPPDPPPPAGSPWEDRRQYERRQAPLDLVVTRLDASGAKREAERTIAETIGPGGVSVMSTIDTLGVGDRVLVEEVWGDFTAHASVRHEHTGTDRIRRLGLAFLDGPFPERFQRPSPAPTPQAPATPPAPRRPHVGQGTRLPGEWPRQFAVGALVALAVLGVWFLWQRSPSIGRRAAAPPRGGPPATTAPTGESPATSAPDRAGAVETESRPRASPDAAPSPTIAARTTPPPTQPAGVGRRPSADRGATASKVAAPIPTTQLGRGAVETGSRTPASAPASRGSPAADAIDSAQSPTGSQRVDETAAGAASTGAVLGWSEEESDLPVEELAKLQGVAGWSGTTLTLTLHNGSTWRITELFVKISRLEEERFVEAESPTRLLAVSEHFTTGVTDMLDRLAPGRRKPGVNPLDTRPFEAEVGPRPEAYRWKIEGARGYAFRGGS